MSYTVPFAELGKNDVPLAGGKGANLGEMVCAGFPIPPGFVLTTAAYDAFVQTNNLQNKIVGLATTITPQNPQSSETISAAIRKLFLAGEMPDDIRTELLVAYANLVDDGAAPVAVRSSATVEDLPNASFAGQQDTFLNIQDEDALLDAVKQCWASLWTARAIAYRLKQGIDPANVSLAVVVQQLIPADAAGILFTANPLDGVREQIVINATWGLGEAIVGGKVTPDTAVVDKTTWQILSRETATKMVMTVRTEDGTEEQSVPVDKQNEAVLDENTAVSLAKLGAQIEAHYDQPMDIEWAIADGEIAILQARPITNLPPAPLKNVRWDPPHPGTVWMRRQVVEHMPEPLSPLFDELYLQEGLDHSMDSMAEFISDLSGIEINVWDFVDPPFAATVNGYAYSVASFKFSPELVPMALRVYIKALPKMLKHLIPRWRDQSLPHYLAAIEQWKQLDLAEASDEELLRGIRELATEDAIYWFAAAVPLGLARMADAAFDRFIKFAVPNNRLSSGSFLRGYPSQTTTAQAELEAIARQIDASDALREQVLNTPASDLRGVLAEHPDIRVAFQDYLDAYGHQIYNLDFAAPTLADDPLPVLLSLQTAVAHPERDVIQQQAELVRERDVLIRKTEQVVNPLLRPIYKLLLGWAQRYSPNREVALFYVGAAWPALRRLAHDLGWRLTDAGSLYDPDDVFYLRSAELAEASKDRANGVARPDLAQLAQERRTLREAQMRLDPPVTVPEDGRLKFGPIDMAMFEPKPRSVGTGPTLDGFAVSPGTVTAPASVLRSPADFDKMQPDTILVCTTTTPAWTPLFAQAKGLVTDIGGALAHGSIVAREYGIPAVMGTGVATQRIKAGQMIRVDGDSGKVILVDELDPQEEARIEAKRMAQKQATRQRKLLAALLAGLVVLLMLLWKKRR